MSCQRIFPAVNQERAVKWLSFKIVIRSKLFENFQRPVGRQSNWHLIAKRFKRLSQPFLIVAADRNHLDAGLPEVIHSWHELLQAVRHNANSRAPGRK